MLDQTEFQNARYSALIALWCHHNTIQLQWPPVIVGAALLIISNIIPGKVAKISNGLMWGRDPELILVVGIPMLVTGLGLLILVYIMKRARSIMGHLENEISAMDRSGNIAKEFCVINHPPGFSGARLIFQYLLICCALPITIFGAIFCLGLKLGFIFLVVPTLSLVVINLRKKLRR